MSHLVWWERIPGTDDLGWPSGGRFQLLLLGNPTVIPTDGSKLDDPNLGGYQVSNITHLQPYFLGNKLGLKLPPGDRLVMQHFLLCSTRPCKNAWSVMVLVATSSTSSSKAQNCTTVTDRRYSRERSGRVFWTPGWSAKFDVDKPEHTGRVVLPGKVYAVFIQMSVNVAENIWNLRPCTFGKMEVKISTLLLEIKTKFRELNWYVCSVSSDVCDVDMIQIWCRYSNIFSNQMPSTVQLSRCFRYAEMDILTVHLVFESFCAKEIIQLPLNRRILLITHHMVVITRLPDFFGQIFVGTFW